MTRSWSNRTFRMFVALATAGLLTFGLVATGVFFPPPRTGPESIPTGGQPPWSWGTPENDTGLTMTGCPSTAGHYCYSIEIGDEAALNTSNTQLTIRRGDTSIPWPAPPENDTVSLVCYACTSVAAVYNTNTSLWTLLGSFSGAFMGGDEIVIYTAETGSGFGLLGDSLVCIGVNGAAFTAPSNSFP
jgi:hypothetical protein